MTVRPLSARSVVLSLLLGVHPPELPVSALVDAGELFDIAEPTLRVALTRMVTAGDLDRTDGTYRLSPRLLERQRRQDVALDPALVPWDGSWETVVVTSSGRSATDRAGLRAMLTELRLAELREGIWLRPANLARPLPAWPADLITTLHATPAGDPAELAGRLFATSAWDHRAQHLLTSMDTANTGAHRIALAATIVRHLRTDPVLPALLLPPGWTGPALRAAYAAYQEELQSSGVQISPTV